MFSLPLKISILIVLFSTHNFVFSRELGRSVDRPPPSRPRSEMCHRATKASCFNLYYGRVHHLRDIELPRLDAEVGAQNAALPRKLDEQGRQELVVAGIQAQNNLLSRLVESNEQRVRDLANTQELLTRTKDSFQSLRGESLDQIVQITQEFRNFLYQQSVDFRSRLTAVDRQLQMVTNQNNTDLLRARSIYQNITQSMQRYATPTAFANAFQRPESPEGRQALESLNPEVRGIVLSAINNQNAMRSPSAILNRIVVEFNALEISIVAQKSAAESALLSSRAEKAALDISLNQANSILAGIRDEANRIRQRIAELPTLIASIHQTIGLEDLRWHCCDNVPFCNSLPVNGSNNEADYQAFEQLVASRPDKHEGCRAGGDPDYN